MFEKSALISDWKQIEICGKVQKTAQSFLHLTYRISANRRRGVYLVRCSVWCGDYSRAAFITLGSMTVPRTQLAHRRITVDKLAWLIQETHLTTGARFGKVASAD